MHLSGVEFLLGFVTQVGYSAKMVFNEHGAIVFPIHFQHRDQKADHISYEDNYAGNALAAMINAGSIEIRYHRDFSDARVARIMAALRANPQFAFASDWRVTYQGRLLR